MMIIMVVFGFKNHHHHHHHTCIPPIFFFCFEWSSRSLSLWLFSCIPWLTTTTTSTTSSSTTILFFLIVKWERKRTKIMKCYHSIFPNENQQEKTYIDPHWRHLSLSLFVYSSKYNNFYSPTKIYGCFCLLLLLFG